MNSMTMKDKLIILVSISVLFISQAIPADILWTDDGADSLWTNPANWSTSTEPSSLDDVRIEVFEPKSGPIISFGENAHSGALKLRDSTLVIEGDGVLNVSGWAGIGSWGGINGILEMKDNAVMYVADVLDIGYGQQGRVTVNSSASIICSKRLKIARTDGNVTGTGHLQLNGGTFQTSHLVINNDGDLTFGTMDITGGKLIIEADEVGVVNNYVNEGLITAFGGHPSAYINVEYAGSSTIVTAEGPVWASEPEPQDGYPANPVNLQLRWRESFIASKHDVYFGLDYEDIETSDIYDFDTYKGRQDANNYSLHELEMNRTYYWRVDEINETTGNAWKGPVWSFRTCDRIPVEDFQAYNTDLELQQHWQPDEQINVTLVHDPCAAENRYMLVDYNLMPGQTGRFTRIFEPCLNLLRSNSEFLAFKFYSDTIIDSNSITIVFRDANDSIDAISLNGIKTSFNSEIWNLILVDINDIVNIDLTNVSSISIEIFNADSGTILVDDIVLRPSMCRPDMNCELPSDNNFDGIVNLFDYFIFSSQWLADYEVQGFDYAIDSDNSGAIDIVELRKLANDWLSPDIDDYNEYMEIFDLDNWGYFARSGPIELPNIIEPLTPETSNSFSVPLNNTVICVMPIEDTADIHNTALYKSAELLSDKIYDLQIKPFDVLTEPDKNKTLIVFGTEDNNPFINEIFTEHEMSPNLFFDGISGDGYRISHVPNPWSPGNSIILALGTSFKGSWNAAFILYGAFDKVSRAWKSFDAIYYGQPEDITASNPPIWDGHIDARQVLPIGIDMWNYPTLSAGTFKRILSVLQQSGLNAIRLSPSGFQDVKKPYMAVKKILDLAYDNNIQMVINVGNEKLTHTPHELTEDHWKTICEIKKHPALLSYLMYDELGGGEAYKEIDEQLAFLKATDTSRPVSVIIPSSFKADGFTSAQEDRVDFLRDRGVEIIIMDYYPLGYWVDDHDISRWEHKIRAGYDFNVVPWAIIQAHLTVAHYTIPTPESIRNQTWWCIAARAQGYFFTNPCLYNNLSNRGFLSLDLRPHEDGRFTEICELIPLLKKLRSMLITARVLDAAETGLEFTANEGFGANGAQARFMLEQQRNQKFIVLVNSSLEAAVSTSFTVKRPFADSQLCDMVKGNIVSPQTSNGLYATYNCDLVKGGGACLAFLTTAWNPSPQDDTEIETSPILTWESAIPSFQYDVYLDTDHSSVINAADYSVSPGVGRVSNMMYQTNDLTPGRYCWRVDLVDSNGNIISKGDVWSFKIK